MNLAGKLQIESVANLLPLRRRPILVDDPGPASTWDTTALETESDGGEEPITSLWELTGPGSKEGT